MAPQSRERLRPQAKSNPTRSAHQPLVNQGVFAFSNPFIPQPYRNELMKNGWRMKEIDEMDMLGFLRLRAWDATREQEKKKPRQRFIDEVWPGVKPG